MRLISYLALLLIFTFNYFSINFVSAQNPCVYSSDCLEKETCENSVCVSGDENLREQIMPPMTFPTSTPTPTPISNPCTTNPCAPGCPPNSTCSTPTPTSTPSCAECACLSDPMNMRIFLDNNVSQSQIVADMKVVKRGKKGKYLISYKQNVDDSIELKLKIDKGIKFLLIYCGGNRCNPNPGQPGKCNECFECINVGTKLKPDWRCVLQKDAECAPKDLQCLTGLTCDKTCQCVGTACNKPDDSCPDCTECVTDSNGNRVCSPKQGVSCVPSVPQWGCPTGQTCKNCNCSCDPLAKAQPCPNGGHCCNPTDDGDPDRGNVCAECCADKDCPFGWKCDTKTGNCAHK